ncbi:MAG TPA: hypothetical protein VF177_18065, partial [Anaerolineae bacterium]
SIGNIPILDHENLLRLGWYLSPVGVWLGVLGICILLWQVNRKTAVMLATGLLFSALFIWSIRANPHQIYTMRRYVPAAMPLFIVGAACFVAWLASRRRPWFTGLALALAAAWLGGLLWSARGFVTQVDYRGTLAQISQINDRLAPHSILLFNDQAPIGQGDILGTPLRFLYGHDVLTLRQPDDERLSGLSHAIQQWQAAGRTVYWIDVPAGQVEKAPLASIRLLQPYQVETTILEMTYDHRPSALVQLAWSGDIYLLEPVPTAVSQP